MVWMQALPVLFNIIYRKGFVSGRCPHLPLSLLIAADVDICQPR